MYKFTLRMDVEKLILAVKNRPAIWDKRLKLHASRIVNEKCWLEISHEMNYDEALLRKKWKYLRDQFNIELTKLPPKRPGDSDDSQPRSKWQYFQQLLFLKDIVKPRSSSGSSRASAAGSSSVSVQDEREEQNTTPVAVADTSQTVHDTSHTNHGCGGIPFTEKERKRKRRTDNYQQSLLKIEEMKLQYLLDKSTESVQQSSDDDLLFLKSLLPYMKMVSGQKKLILRRRLQDAIEEVVYSADCNTLRTLTPTSHSCQSSHSHSSAPSLCDSGNIARSVSPKENSTDNNN